MGRRDKEESRVNDNDLGQLCVRFAKGVLMGLDSDQLHSWVGAEDVADEGIRRAA